MRRVWSHLSFLVKIPQNRVISFHELTSIADICFRRHLLSATCPSLELKQHTIAPHRNPHVSGSGFFLVNIHCSLAQIANQGSWLWAFPLTAQAKNEVKEHQNFWQFDDLPTDQTGVDHPRQCEVVRSDPAGKFSPSFGGMLLQHVPWDAAPQMLLTQGI